MNSAILFHERLSILRGGPTLAALLLVLLCIAYAGWSGDRWRDAQLNSVQTYEREQLAALAEWRAQLAGIEAGEIVPTPYDANPMSISFPAVLPPAALADFAVGHSDLLPNSADISPWRNIANVFGRYQFDNPTTLASSSFDVALVVVMLMPLLMIVISFDVLAGERSRGTLATVLASPTTLAPLAWTKLAFRSGLLWIVAVMGIAVLAIINDAGGDRLARLALWLVVSVLYGLFWLALIAYCVARFRTAMATAGALIAAWLVFTLALPATLATLSESLYPTPSRLAFLSEVLEAQGDTNRNLAELTDGFLMDHPDLTVGDENLPSYFRAAFLSNEAARETTRPIVEAYAVARHGRERSIAWAQYLSPSIIVQRLLMQCAGADLGRQHRYQAQVDVALRDLADRVGPAVVSRNRLTLAEFDELQPFEFEDVSIAQIASSAALPLAFLAVLSLVVGIAAHRELRRHRLGG